MPNTFIYVLNLSGLVVAVVYAWITVSRLRNTSATYNARLLPFAYYSLSCWILWALQYLVWIGIETQRQNLQQNLPYPTITPDNFLVSTVRWLASIQTMLLVVAVYSLYSRLPPRLSFTLPSLTAFSILTAFLSYGSNVLTSDAYFKLDLVLSAIAFVAFVPATIRLRLSKVFAAVFIIYGLSQIAWLLFASSAQARAILLVFPLLRAALLFSWARMIVALLQRAQASYERVVGEIKGLELLPNPTETFRVMISSTVNDLHQERDAAERAIRALHLDRFRAETFGSLPHTPRKVCESLAKECDLFILIIGQRYGYVIEPEGISVVQLEYEVARAENPKKILVYVKNNEERESRLQEFLQKVQDFESGYFRSSFDTPEELYERIHIDVARWLASQAKQKAQIQKQPNMIQQGALQSPADA
jgi:hypothetical protein